MNETALEVMRLGVGLGALHFLGLGLLAGISFAVGGFAWSERLTLSFGLGSLSVTLWMLALSSLKLPFSLGLIFLPLGLLAGVGFLAGIIRRKQPPTTSAAVTDCPPPAPAFLPYSGWDWLFLSLLAVVFLFAFLQAALFPISAWDALATWGFKGKVFYLSRSLDFTGYEAHNYYPNLVPLLLSYLYFCLGQFDDCLVQALFPYWGALLLVMLYAFGRRLGLSRTQALGVTTFFALNGVAFIHHLTITYADLSLAYFALGAVGWLYLWLKEAAPRSSLTLVALFCAGAAWCKHEGPPLAGTILLAAALTLAWLRPRGWRRRLLLLAWPLAGIFLGTLPWRWYMAAHHIEGGSDHVLGFYLYQSLQALPFLLAGLGHPTYFGFLWPTLALVVAATWKTWWTTPNLFLLLFVGGNLLAVLLAYGLAPTSAAEFPFYIRGTLDRLLLHITPVAGLALAAGLAVNGERFKGRQ